MSDAPAELFIVIDDDDDHLERIEELLLKEPALNYSRDEASALTGTLAVLRKLSIPPPMIFSPSTLTLFPPHSSDEPTIAPSESTLEFLKQLSIMSRDAASGLIMSSLIAGRRSESEDHGDVAFWVGDVDEQRVPESILETLHITAPAEVFFLENQSDELITSLTMISPVELNAASRLLSPALDLLAQLDKMFECRIVISEEDGLVLYMCAGAYNGEWCGLMGVSVEAD